MYYDRSFLDNAEIPQRYSDMILDRLWRAQAGQYFCVSTKSASKKWRDTFFKRSELGKVAAFIEDNRDKDLYFCPHGFSKPERRKEYAVTPHMLWSDLDEVDPAKIKLKPTIAIESSVGRFVGLWLLDGDMTEALNRRLSYHIGADKSGWDFTQVLRIPGTTNYKYASMPRTRILWSDGATYTVKELERTLPRLKDEDKPRDTGDASEVYKRAEKKLPHWLRRELMDGNPVEGQRSEMIWKLENGLIEAGLSTEEAFVLIKASPWNKFAGRRNEDEQLERELDKIVKRHLNGSKRHAVTETKRSAHREEDDEEDEEVRLLFRPMDTVEEENINWIWYPYLARGELTILEGDPGLGKSYLAQMVCAHISDGRGLPLVKEFPTVTGSTVYFDMENSAGTVTKKRLATNGLKHMERFVQCEEPFSVEDQNAWDIVNDYFETHKPTVAVFDTVNTYLGKADAFKSTEAQQAFMKFRDLAQRFNCAVITLRHLTKSSKERALYRGQGNIAFAGIARVIITVGQIPNDDDEEKRVMAVTKLNIARHPKALTFFIRELPDTSKEKDRSEFKWGEFIELTSDDILAALPIKGKDADAAGVKKFLKAQLGKGPQDRTKIERMCDARSITLKALKKACEELGVITEVSGQGKERRTLLRLAEKPKRYLARIRQERHTTH